jgi:cytidylate kinase
MIIAIDGTAGVGKGTLAKGLGETLNLAILDTGLLYRAVAYEMKRDNTDLEDIAAAQLAAQELSLETLDHPDLRTPEISLIASKISAYPLVRDALTHFQREFAYHPPKGYSGTLLDGRDIGTVICPNATFKFFLKADIEIRAKRRYVELVEKKQKITFEELLAQMILRDHQDSSRLVSPLKPALDAYVLDTGHLTREEVLKEALKVVLKSH